MSRDLQGVMHYPTITELQNNPLYSYLDDIANELTKSVQITPRYGSSPPTIAPPVAGDLYWNQLGTPKAALYVYNGTSWDNTTASIWSKIDELFHVFPQSVSSPGPNTFTRTSISGFDAYNSPDFPSNYQVGIQVFGSGPQAAQLSFGWNHEENAPGGAMSYRVNDDTGTTSSWGAWSTLWDSTNLHPSDYLNRSGGQMLGDIDLNGHRILNAPDPTDPLELSNKNFVDTNFLKLNGTDWEARGKRITNTADPEQDTDAVNKKFLTLNCMTTVSGLIAPNDEWDARQQRIINVADPSNDGSAVNLGFMNLHKLDKIDFEKVLTLQYNQFKQYDYPTLMGLPFFDPTLLDVQSIEYPFTLLGGTSTDVNTWGHLGITANRDTWENDITVDGSGGGPVLELTVSNLHSSQSLVLQPRIKAFDAIDDVLMLKLVQCTYTMGTGWDAGTEVFTYDRLGPSGDVYNTTFGAFPNQTMPMPNVTVPPKTTCKFVFYRLIGSGSSDDRLLVNKFSLFYEGFQ